MTIILVIGILVLLIVAHELGHFLAAKLFRVRVEEFGVGYPPKAISFGTWGGTEYTLNWLPFGGFVRLFGEDMTEASPPKGAFSRAPLYAQAIILVAGVSANALIAYALFAGAFMAGLPHAVDETSPDALRASLVVASVVPGSPADQAGIIPGDAIKGVRDDLGVSAPLLPSAITEYVKARGGKEVTVELERAGAIREETLRPAHAVIPGEAGRPAVGFGLVLVSEEAMTPAVALREAGPRTLGAFAAVGQGLWKIVSDAFRGSGDLSEVVGPVGLYGIVGDAAKHGAANVLALAAFISVNLAIVNLFPIPALDGGRLVMVGYEAVARRTPPRRLFSILNMIGLALIALLMVAVTFNDISRLLA